MMLSERQRSILQSIVENYIRSAEPVGSRTIAKHSNINYSSATIRNEMADLEELGYLEQPHTSAGRIPSEKGYRYYVDNLLLPDQISVGDIESFRELFKERYFEIDQSIRQAALILSELTSYTSIILGPEIFQTHLRQIQIVPLDFERAVAIIITDTGKVENKLVSIPQGVSMDQIDKMVNLINHRLRGVTLAELQGKIFTELSHAMQKNLEQYEQLQGMLNDLFAPTSSAEDRVFLGGKMQILAQPEFRDVDKAKMMFQLLEQNDTMVQLFHNPTKGVTIKIGRENNNDLANDCSVISASYELDGNIVGSIGIIGPTRMEYSKVVGVLGHISRDLTKLLNRLYRSGG